MSIDKETVYKIARLSRIKIENENVDKISSELSAVLNWIDELNEVDTDGIEPLSSITGHKLPTRKDEVRDGGYADRILENAPEKSSGFFVVPKVVE